MRAISLVRAWLYGFRGFVVMTVSLTVAFSVAISGPPTESEIALVTRVVSHAAAGFGDELEAAAIEVCPSLPADVRALCGGEPATQQETHQAPAPVERPPSPAPAPSQAANQPEPPPEARSAETRLLGGPPRRERAERAEPQRRAQRASPQRRATVQRAQTERRPPPRRPAAQRTAQRPTEAVREAPPPVQTAPAVVVGDESLQNDIVHAAEAYRDDEYRGEIYTDDESEYEAWAEERRRARRERRRAYEREEEQYRDEASPEEYPEEEPYYEDPW